MDSYSANKVKADDELSQFLIFINSDVPDWMLYTKMYIKKCSTDVSSIQSLGDWAIFCTSKINRNVLFYIYIIFFGNVIKVRVQAFKLMLNINT